MDLNLGGGSELFFSSRNEPKTRLMKLWRKLKKARFFFLSRKKRKSEPIEAQPSPFEIAVTGIYARPR